MNFNHDTCYYEISSNDRKTDFCLLLMTQFYSFILNQFVSYKWHTHSSGEGKDEFCFI